MRSFRWTTWACPAACNEKVCAVSACRLSVGRLLDSSALRRRLMAVFTSVSAAELTVQADFTDYRQYQLRCRLHPISGYRPIARCPGGIS